MKNPRFSFEEFESLFRDDFPSPEQLRREYESFLSILEQLDRAAVPELSAGAKAAIFRRAWEERLPKWSWVSPWLAVFRRPAAAFAAGVVLGCILMVMIMSGRSDTSGPRSVREPLTIERTPYTRTYRGRVVESMYPQIERPKIVVERTGESSPPQRVLYGTLDNGEIYVAWNL